MPLAAWNVMIAEQPRQEKDSGRRSRDSKRGLNYHVELSDSQLLKLLWPTSASGRPALASKMMQLAPAELVQNYGSVASLSDFRRYCPTHSSYSRVESHSTLEWELTAWLEEESVRRGYETLCASSVVSISGLGGQPFVGFCPVVHLQPNQMPTNYFDSALSALILK